MVQKTYIRNSTTLDVLAEHGFLGNVDPTGGLYDSTWGDRPTCGGRHPNTNGYRPTGGDCLRDPSI